VDLHYASASTLARAIRQKEVSALEVVEACLRRIESVNPKVNALVLSTSEAARDAARQADAALARGQSLGPLHGVPFSIKDSLDTMGVVTTAGTAGWASRVPPRDATVVARLKAAGGILLGKTNTPELTIGDETDNALYGRTSNPYDLTRTPGGSSGGAAALIAAGGTPFDIGSDSARSIRLPAHNCGVAGLKPTHGRVPRTGHVRGYEEFIQSWHHLGPLARYVEDLALILPIISGSDGEDPYIAPVPLLDPNKVVVSRLRVLCFTDNGLRTPTPDTVQTIEAAALALRDEGARVQMLSATRLPPALNAAIVIRREMSGADGGASIRRLLARVETPVTGPLGERLGSLKPVTAGELTEMLERMDGIRATLTRFIQDYDVIVCPVMPMPAVPHGGSRNNPGYGDTYSEVHNITGWPAAVVRGGTSAEGLPIGVQVVAQPWREDVALVVASALERALGGWQPPAI
jgi:amidase